MIYDKRQGSLLNYIQRPLNVVTPYGTYLGLLYNDDKPDYILSDVKVKCYQPEDLTFSIFSKDFITKEENPILELTNDDTIGFGYKVSPIELKTGYITVASKRIDITTGIINRAEAEKILEKQLRNIGNIIEQFVHQPISQTQYDALLIHFFYEGVDSVEDSAIVKMVNEGLWFEITDEIQTNIKRANGKVDDNLAKRRMAIANIWSYVPGYS